MADALSRRHTLLIVLENELTNFDSITEQYEQDENFQEVLKKLKNFEKVGDYFIQEGFLFKGNQLCIPKTHLTEQLTKELHEVLAADSSKDKLICL